MLTHALLLCYFFIVTPTPGIYTLSLHDALPISGREQPGVELRGERAGPVAVKSLPLARLAQRRVEMIEQRHRDVSWRRGRPCGFYPPPRLPAKVGREVPLTGGREACEQRCEGVKRSALLRASGQNDTSP